MRGALRVRFLWCEIVLRGVGAPEHESRPRRWFPPSPSLSPPKGARGFLLLPCLALLASVVAGQAAARPLAQAPSQEQLSEVEQRTIGLRTLPRLAPINLGVMPREELRAHQENRFWEEVTADEIEASQLFLEALGYVEQGWDLVRAVFDVLGEEVLGFYDIRAKTLYVVLDRPEWGPREITTLAHEITHALQDQHYDLEAGHRARRDENDRQMAYTALVEGDATLAMLLYAQRYLTRAETEEAFSGSSGSALDQAPLILQRELAFPYLDGVGFVADHFRQGGWEAVARLWADPPESTEQVLHPERYRAGDRPITVGMPGLRDALGPGWRMMEENTLGELDWRVLFEQYADAATADRAGTGWGGDRFQLLRRDEGGALVLAMRTAWDSEADAVEFFESYQKVAARRHGADLQILADSPSTWHGRATPWSHRLTRRGSQVVLVVDTDPAAGSTALDLLLG